jgi:ParB family chromosome partitioning protein
MTRKALGRGLGALLSPERDVVAQQTQVVPIDSIEPNPLQPRSRFDQTKLNELAQSIAENGVVQPLVVRRKGTGYELIAGERRWRAAQSLGLTTIPITILDVPDDKLLELALIENIQREELNAIEEAQAYQKLIETIGLTQDVLAKRVGRDRSYITNYLRLLKLPEDLQRLVQEGQLSTGHARTILALTDEEAQRRLAKKIIDDGLSVREVERLVRDGAPAAARPKGVNRSRTQDPNVAAAETRLRRKFGTKVRIVQQPGSQRGRIEFEFYSSDDLNRLYDLLLESRTTAAQV